MAGQPEGLVISSGAQKPWGFWFTSLFALVEIGTLYFVLERDWFPRLDPAMGFGVISLLASSISVILAMVFAGLKPIPYTGYFACNPASASQWKKTALAFLVFTGSLMTLNWALDRPPAPDFLGLSISPIYSQAFAALIVIVVIPLAEELFTRGFLYAGWSQSWLGPLGSVLLCSLVWTVQHGQYDWYDLGQVFAAGIFLGMVRWKTGSLWPAVACHVLFNIIAVAEALWVHHR